VSSHARGAVQKPLGWEDLRPAPLNGNGKKGGFYDPAFTGNRTEPLHRWVPWIAGYSSRFVDEVLASYNGTEVRSRVLDPFAGVGTTLVQARFRGCDAVGFELNPFAALVTKVKLAAGVELHAEVLSEAAAEYRSFARSHRTPSRRPPDGFRSRIPFFSPRIERKVLVALDYIDSVDNRWVADAFRVALGAVMVSFSNYTYEPSLCSRPGAGKELIEDADVSGVVAGKAINMADDIAQLEKVLAPEPTERIVHNRSFFEYGQVEKRSCDIAITSPPYLNNYHYLRNTRPHLWWLGLVDSPVDANRIENESMGKYWQTVRSGLPVELGFDNRSIESLLSRIRLVRPGHGAYGGLGWANYAATYFNDTRRWLQVLHSALRPGGMAIIVIGNSIIQGVGVATDQILAEIGGLVGFEIVATDRLRNKRVGGSILQSSVRRGEKPGPSAGLYESAVILRRLV
jgi:SAM-dependent methyltransferase